MTMNKKSLNIIEFPKIKEKLAACAQTEGGRELCLNLMPATDIDKVRLRQTLTTQARSIAEVKGQPSFYGVCDVISCTERASKGASLSMRDLLHVAAVLR